jgi:hypothetical protein
MRIVMGIAAWLIKNTALLIGVLEAISKAIAGIVSLTPTKGDDKIVDWVDKIFSAIKKLLYTLSNNMVGK